MDNAHLQVLDHPLVKHKITLLRDKNTSVKEFRELIKEVALLLAYEVTRNYSLKPMAVQTPLEAAVGYQLKAPVCIVPILRAGLGMVDGFLTLLPTAKVGHIGLQRNEETLEPMTYYDKMPPHVEEMQVIVVDPMLATGGSASAAIAILKQKGVRQIKLASIIGATVGIEAVRSAHPDVEIYVAQVDDKLNENGYIVPGLGDAGDRIFGTLAVD